jgi:phosphoribosylpyrophosphate synthetase
MRKTLRCATAKKEDRKTVIVCSAEKSRKARQININFPLCSFSRQKKTSGVVVHAVSGLRTLLHEREEPVLKKW